MGLELADFTKNQVQELNQQHSSPVADSDELFTLLNGHPYLTRKALYILVIEPLTWHDLTHVVAGEQGPFGDHLRHYHWLLRDEPDLKAAPITYPFKKWRRTVWRIPPLR